MKCAGCKTSSKLIRVYLCEACFDAFREALGLESCESGLKDCGPVEAHDVEGVPLCARCAKELAAEENPRKEDR